MGADVYGQFLRFQVAETTAATLKEGNAITTGAQSRLSGGGFLAIEVHQIVSQLSDPADAVGAAAVEDVTGAISTRSALSTIPEMDEEHVIYKRGIRRRAGVATYLPEQTYERFMPPVTNFPLPLLVSHTKLYPYVISTNAAAFGDFRGYLFYNYVDVSGELAVEALEAFR